MSIDSAGFLALVGLTVLASILAPDNVRKQVLLASSVVFYVSSGCANAIIIFALFLANYGLLVGLQSATNDMKRTRFYYASIALNAAFFFTFKFGLEPSPKSGGEAWNILGFAVHYPLGLSFIILMLHSALTDIYSRAYVWRGNFAAFTLFASFFPYVTAGPIARLKTTADALQRPPKPTKNDVLEGMCLIALGLVKKFVVANRLYPYTSSIFGGDQYYSSLSIAFYLALNASYIYSDFSGYTDLARGAARCLGVRIDVNFDRPFRSQSVTEFWRRWHITFSSWLRDYLYTPLAFSLRRLDMKGVILALIVTFILCGFWHGAAWTFILFGSLHGVMIVAELLIAKSLPPTVGINLGGRLSTFLKRLYTLMFLVGTMALFSARNLSEAASLIHYLFTRLSIPSVDEMVGYKGPVLFCLMLAAIAAWRVFEAWYRCLTPAAMPWFLLAASLVFLFLGQSVGGGFVYAQF